MTCSLRTSLAIALLVLAGACTPAEPTPAQLKTMLLKNPDVLYDVVRAHPDTFLAIINRAARAAQARTQATSLSADSIRIDSELAHPRHVSTAGRAGFGAPNAPVTIVEYTDFECPFCRQERDVLVRLLQEYPQKVRLVVKQFPVPTHPHAYPAALMFEAVARQSPAKAYKLYDILYTNQSELVRRGEPYLLDAVRESGADVSRAERDAASDTVKAIVDADRKEGDQLGFTGTPGFLVNGVLLQGTYPASIFERIINAQLAQLSTVAR
jgi:protein-disulfide isomerase